MNRVLLVSVTALIVPLAHIQAQVTPLRRSVPTEKISVLQRDDILSFQDGRGQRRGLEVVPVMAVTGAMAGAGGVLAARMFYFGFLMVASCETPCEAEGARAFEHFPKYESIGLAIGVGVGFVLGVVLFSQEQRRQGETGGREQRVSAVLLPQSDGRFRFGTLVRF